MTQSDSLNSKSSDDESITLTEIYRSLLRKKNLLIFSFLTLFTFAIAFTINQRVRFPVYRGSFSLLVSDPISGKDSGGTSKGEQFQSFAKGRGVVDLETIKVYLKSPVVIQPLVEEFKLTTNYLQKIISVKSNVKDRKPIYVLTYLLI